jgi:VWFA-related protein
MKTTRTVAFAIVALFPALWAFTQTPIFKVVTKEVRIDVLVADHGTPVTGLQASDFEILDNGVRQEIEFAKYEEVPISTILVFDMSDSVAGERLSQLQDAGKTLLSGLGKDESAALITFSHAVQLDIPPTTNLERVKAALDTVHPSGYTSLIDATYSGLMIAEAKSTRPLMIVFSDSLDTSSWLEGEDVLQAAKGGDAVVYAVSAGRLPDSTFLRSLCKFTGGSLFEVDSTKNLGKTFLDILEEFGRRYLLTYIPRGVPAGGWHSLDVRVKHPHDRVTHRPGYMQELTSP